MSYSYLRSIARIKVLKKVYQFIEGVATTEPPPPPPAPGGRLATFTTTQHSYGEHSVACSTTTPYLLWYAYIVVNEVNFT